MHEYVFRLAPLDLATYFWVAVCALGAAWPFAIWRLLPLARRAIQARQLGVAIAAWALSVCPLLLTPTVQTRLHEQSLTIRVGATEVVESSLLGTHAISLGGQLDVTRNEDNIVLSDGRDRITLPAGRRWRLQYPFMNTEELVAEILARAADRT
ncbi:MAG: hypothetical protein HRF45_06785 [Fimbriimonadia bacterium]|jgi:hypothetical protein